jgi:sodium-dependent dicarboxylate transporter 2/3/5
MGILFFVIPRNSRGFFSGCEPHKPLLEWNFVQSHFPWGIIILLGGGYALSKGAKESGLTTEMGEWLRALEGLPPSILQLTVMVIIACLTEVASNSATASIVIPILLELSQKMNIHPLYLTLPATITCSYAFMLPVSWLI